MKNKGLTITLIVILTIICLALTSFMFFIINGNFNVFNFHLNIGSSESKELVFDETYAKIFDEINIKSEYSNIYIKTAEDDEIRVLVYSDKDDIDVVEDKNNLNITVNKKKCIGFCFNRDISRVEVYVPKDFDKSLGIVNGYGDIEIDNLEKANIKAESDCGDISILGAKDVLISNDYGDIELGTVLKANIKQSAGETKIDKVDYITVESSYGDIKIDYVGAFLNLSADCGDIKINEINLIKDSKIINNLGSIKIGNTNEIYFDAKTDLGDIDINNNFPKSDITLRVENDCGDIKINN